MKKIVISLIIISLIVIIGIIFKDFNIITTYSYNSRFECVYKEGCYEIIVDTKTKVMYLQSTRTIGTSGCGGLTLMVDAEGKPLLWKE